MIPPPQHASTPKLGPFLTWLRQVRAEVFHTLEGPKEGTRPATLSNESLLINELVREYLTYSGYHNALSVFMAESGQPQDRALDRAFIRDEVKWPTVVGMNMILPSCWYIEEYVWFEPLLMTTALYMGVGGEI